MTDIPDKKARAATKRANEVAKQLELELVRFSTGDRQIEFNIDITAETVWATQQQIADLFEVDRSVITKHLKNVFESKELEESRVCAIFAHTAADGKAYQVQHYNLDAILSVGYRVSSPKATRFRQWANQTLRSYLVDGYALNERRLKDAPAALAKLAAEVRRLRSDEKNIYASVRECFKVSATDYDTSSPTCRRFYARLQDKFHYAITGSTASQIIIDRADYKKPNMGLQTLAGNLPTRDEINIGKNYLDNDELYRLHILCEQFLLYAESTALRGKQLTMEELDQKFDALIRVNDYPVFPGYKDYLKDKAVRHAQAEYAKFLMRLTKDDVKRIDRRPSV
ncbi:RhuM family protein [Chelatococcus sp. GCM10030263]|uniref:RhuM family protein n=1 Tax=Chelatococcus sp. GCM10030263 TaxID=3273387 RepID=UPI0036095705